MLRLSLHFLKSFLPFLVLYVVICAHVCFSQGNNVYFDRRGGWTYFVENKVAEESFLPVGQCGHL